MHTALGCHISALLKEFRVRYRKQWRSAGAGLGAACGGTREGGWNVKDWWPSSLSLTVGRGPAHRPSPEPSEKEPAPLLHVHVGMCTHTDTYTQTHKQTNTQTDVFRKTNK